MNINLELLHIILRKIKKSVTNLNSEKISKISDKDLYKYYYFSREFLLKSFN